MLSRGAGEVYEENEKCSGCGGEQWYVQHIPTGPGWRFTCVKCGHYDIYYY